MSSGPSRRRTDPRISECFPRCVTSGPPRRRRTETTPELSATAPEVLDDNGAATTAAATCVSEGAPHLRGTMNANTVSATVAVSPSLDHPGGAHWPSSLLAASEAISPPMTPGTPPAMPNSGGATAVANNQNSFWPEHGLSAPRAASPQTRSNDTPYPAAPAAAAAPAPAQDRDGCRPVGWSGSPGFGSPTIWSSGPVIPPRGP